MTASDAGRFSTDSTMHDLVCHARATGNEQLEIKVLRWFGFAIPTDAAVELIAGHAPNGVVEIGAGTGFWARQLANAGVDVVAYDIDPPPSTTNQWFAGTSPWFPVDVGTEQVVASHPDRTLLLVWPTRNAAWPSKCVALFHQAGGQHVVYVGDPAGSATGSEDFQALLGETKLCVQCSYRVVDSPCICDIRPVWTRTADLALPAWQGTEPRLRLYTRAARHDP